VTATYAEPAMARYRDSVTELMEAGERFGAVEDAIDAAANLSEEAKAALWLLAFSMRDRCDQLRDARAHLVALG
jgi:hypothetical protein